MTIKTPLAILCLFASPAFLAAQADQPPSLEEAPTLEAATGGTTQAFYIFGDFFQYNATGEEYAENLRNYVDGVTVIDEQLDEPEGELAGFTIGYEFKRWLIEASFRTGELDARITDRATTGGGTPTTADVFWTYEVERSETEIRTAYKWDFFSLGGGFSYSEFDVTTAFDFVVVSGPIVSDIPNAENSAVETYTFFLDGALYYSFQVTGDGRDGLYVAPKFTGSLGYEFNEDDLAADGAEAEGTSIYRVDGVLQVFYIIGQHTLSVEGGYRQTGYFSEDDSFIGDVGGFYGRAGYKFSF